MVSNAILGISQNFICVGSDYLIAATMALQIRMYGPFQHFNNNVYCGFTVKKKQKHSYGSTIIFFVTKILVLILTP